MNNRIKKKKQKRLEMSVNLGYLKLMSYRDIKLTKRIYHKYDLCLR